MFTKASTCSRALLVVVVVVVLIVVVVVVVLIVVVVVMVTAGCGDVGAGVIFYWGWCIQDNFF